MTLISLLRDTGILPYNHTHDTVWPSFRLTRARGPTQYAGTATGENYLLRQQPIKVLDAATPDPLAFIQVEYLFGVAFHPLPS